MKKSAKLIIVTLLLVAVVATSLFAFTACDEVEGYLPAETVKLRLNITDTDLNGIPLGVLFNKDTSYIELDKEGNCTIKLMLVDIATLLAPGEEGEENFIAELVSGLDLTSIKKSDLQLGYIDGYVNVLFPGFTLEDVVGSLALIKKSLGVEIIGLDFANNAKLAALKAQIEDTESDDMFPAGFSLADIPNGVGIVIEAPYALLDVKGTDENGAATYTAAMAGVRDSDTMSFATMTYYKSSSYNEVTWVNEMLGLKLVFSEG